MNAPLTTAGYFIDSNKIWTKTDYQSINYSDGDEVENRLATILNEQHDLSIFSPELKKHCIDWPSTYHLSPQRANLLRPFHKKISTSSVLEIGAGCGAITRYLGESGAHVIALEGSYRRASITRTRTRDLENVHVVANRFDEFNTAQRFDIITLIGVLEYANLFMPGDNPALAMLKQAQSMLAPDGILIIAIENQLGLKYFAGAPEDHIGRSMYGIENRYQKNQAQTYGRQELTHLLKQALFSTIDYYAPFPDYKLPISIISEPGFSCDSFDVAALITQTVRNDPQLPSHLAFAPELVWPSLTKNKLALDLANSFLIVAQCVQKKRVDNSTLAYHYASNRIPRFCKETLFIQENDTSITVIRNRLTNYSTSLPTEQLVTQVIKKQEPYTIGNLLNNELNEIIANRNWSCDDLGVFFKRYISIIFQQLENEISINTPHEISIHTLLPGHFIDLVPQNIIIESLQEKPFSIDTEWHWHEKIPLGFLVFRTLLLIRHTVLYGSTANSKLPQTWLQFFKTIYQLIGLELTESALTSYIEIENALQHAVYMLTSRLTLSWLNDPIQFLNLSDLTEQKNIEFINHATHIDQYRTQLTQVNQTVSEQEQQLALTNQTISEQKQQLALTNQTISEQKQQLALTNQTISEQKQQLALTNQTISEQKQQLALTNQTISEQEQQLALTNQTISEQKQQLALTNQTISEQKQQLAIEKKRNQQMIESRSWRLTAPLRKIRHSIRSRVPSN